MRPPEEPVVTNTNTSPGTAPTPITTSEDPWLGLRRFTSARIALGRAGGSQRTNSVLDFRLAHARARDAVHARLDTAALTAALSTAGLPVIKLATAVTDRRTYLLRPDLGRRLAPESLARLVTLASAPNFAPPDLVVILSDGLSAQAANRHGVATIVPLIASLADAGWRITPVFVVPFARVKIQDEIGATLRTRFTLMLLGERPGLGAPDSLGAYFTKDPAPERTDADRNCISNIRPEGLAPALAAKKLAWLLLESLRTGLSGVHLKDTQPITALA